MLALVFPAYMVFEIMILPIMTRSEQNTNKPFWYNVDIFYVLRADFVCLNILIQIKGRVHVVVKQIFGNFDPYNQYP